MKPLVIYAIMVVEVLMSIPFLAIGFLCESIVIGSFKRGAETCNKMHEWMDLNT